MVGYPIFLLAEVVVGFVILLISFTFLGDLGTPLLNLLRLTALYATVDFCSMLIPAFGLYRVGFSGAVFAILFMNFFDVDIEDAWIVLLINWIAKMAIVVGFILYFQ
ncbi:MAG: hypothetical protein IPJ41_05050 [Phycisphaerales bacterium]|nr:hypothetical protein [Phycisphaerales bacterium]